MSSRRAATAAGRPVTHEVSVVTGGAANAELTLTGFRASRDNITAVILFGITNTEEGKTVTPTAENITSTVTVVKSGKIKTSKATTGDVVLVFWDKTN